MLASSALLFWAMHRFVVSVATGSFNLEKNAITKMDLDALRTAKSMLVSPVEESQLQFVLGTIPSAETESLRSLSPVTTATKWQQTVVAALVWSKMGSSVLENPQNVPRNQWTRQFAGMASSSPATTSNATTGTRRAAKTARSMPAGSAATK